MDGLLSILVAAAALAVVSWLVLRSGLLSWPAASAGAAAETMPPAPERDAVELAALERTISDRSAIVSCDTPTPNLGLI